MDYKFFLGNLSVFLALLSYFPYVTDIFKEKTRPHAFSWLIWSMLTGTAFLAQIQNGGGTGAWVTGSISIACFFIFLLSTWRGEKSFHLVDWISLSGAIIAFALLESTEAASISVILICVIDGLGFIPTLRKSFSRPHEETSSIYLLQAIAFAIALFALKSYSLTTWLYPGVLVIFNALCASFLFIRRKQLGVATHE